MNTTEAGIRVACMLDEYEQGTLRAEVNGRTFRIDVTEIGHQGARNSSAQFALGEPIFSWWRVLDYIGPTGVPWKVLRMPQSSYWYSRRRGYLYLSQVDRIASNVFDSNAGDIWPMYNEAKANRVRLNAGTMQYDVRGEIVGHFGTLEAAQHIAARHGLKVQS